MATGIEPTTLAVQVPCSTKQAIQDHVSVCVCVRACVRVCVSIQMYFKIKSNFTYSEMLYMCVLMTRCYPSPGCVTELCPTEVMTSLITLPSPSSPQQLSSYGVKLTHYVNVLAHYVIANILC